MAVTRSEREVFRRGRSFKQSDLGIGGDQRPSVGTLGVASAESTLNLLC